MRTVNVKFRELPRTPLTGFLDRLGGAELSMGPFSVARPNLTREISEPTRQTQAKY